MYDNFNPDSISKDSMKELAKHIESYVNNLEEVMIIPDEIIDEHGDQIKEGIHRARKLIKKLKKGDKSVFKDMD